MLTSPSPPGIPQGLGSGPESATPSYVDRSGRFQALKFSFKKQLLALAEEFRRTFRQPLIFTDTVRTQAEQAQLHREKPSLALPAYHPRAMHPKGLAVDVDFRQAALLTEDLLARYGLHRPALSKGEIWHIEPRHASPAETPVGVAASRGIPSLSSMTQSLRRETAKAQGSSRGGDLLGLASLSSSSKDHRALSAARELEAMFLEKLLEHSRQALVKPGQAPGEKVQVAQYLLDRQLARTLARAGGIGLAAKILAALSPPNSPASEELRHEKKTYIPDIPGHSGRNPVV